MLPINTFSELSISSLIVNVNYQYLANVIYQCLVNVIYRYQNMLSINYYTFSGLSISSLSMLTISTLSCYLSHPPEICDSAIAAFFADFAHFRRFCPLSQIAENFADFELFLTKKIFGPILSLYFPILTTFLLRNSAILFNVFLLFA